jgi:hypothetical protein
LKAEILRIDVELRHAFKASSPGEGGHNKAALDGAIVDPLVL